MYNEGVSTGMKERTMDLPIIGVTMGDPVGIGPEIIVKALAHQDIYSLCRPLIIGDESALNLAINLIRSPVKISITEEAEKGRYGPECLNICSISGLPPDQLHFGQPTRESGTAMVRYIKEATRLALEGKISALVTAPINKLAMNLAGFRYSGHTELLAELTGVKDCVMMFASPSLKVALVTTHCALREVSSRLTVDSIISKIGIVNEALKACFGIKYPKMAVAALNPHAGEGGLFGPEEEEVIRPAIHLVKEMGMDTTGPLPSDTLFHQAVEGIYDVVVCMYHDQGLIPIKLLHFFEAVNVTLGLPVIRTSVDHGTAYDIAGKGIANPSSLISAMKLAANMADIRRRQD